MNTALDTASRAQVSRVENMLTRLLGDDILGMYLFGSAMNGGLRPKSDIDFLLAVKQPIVGDRRVRLVEQLLALSGDPKRGDQAQPLEVTAVVIDDAKPWRYPARRDLQFGEWLRDEASSTRAFRGSQVVLRRRPAAFAVVVVARHPEASIDEASTGR